MACKTAKTTLSQQYEHRLQQRNKMFILPSVSSLHIYNKSSAEFSGCKHPQNTSTTNTVSIGFTQ